MTNAVLYLVDSGCKWRQLPHDFPSYSTVHSFYRRAKISGLWDKILEHLVKKARTNAGRKESLSYAIIDSQSVKTVAASEGRGIDGGKNERQKAAHRIDLDVDISEKIKPHSKNLCGFCVFGVLSHIPPPL